MAKKNTEKTGKKTKPKGTTVQATIPEEQFNAIKKLDGVLGVGINGVVSNIIHSWLHQQDWFSDIIKEKIKGKKNVKK